MSSLFSLTLVTAVSFGPHQCVSLSRSEQGTCVLHTNCDGIDTSKFDFAFRCKVKGTTTPHTYGRGGFDAAEDYDTTIKCDECMAPAAHTLVATDRVPEEGAANGEDAAGEANGNEDANGAATTAAAADAATTAAPAPTGDLPPSVASFQGPAGCVAVYPSDHGTCMMQTRCTGQNTSDYDFGLTCVDSASARTRHLFGVDSFDPVETFDTLIKCNHCLALDEEQQEKPSGGLVHDVYTLENEMHAVKEDVHEIEEKIASSATVTTVAPESADETTTAAATEAATTAAATEAATTAAAATEAATTAAPAADAGSLFLHRHAKRGFRPTEFDPAHEEQRREKWMLAHQSGSHYSNVYSRYYPAERHNVRHH